MHEPREAPVEITQVRKILGPRVWESRTLGRIDLPPPGDGPEPHLMNYLREAFAEEARIEKLLRARTK